MGYLTGPVVRRGDLPHGDGPPEVTVFQREPPRLPVRAHCRCQFRVHSRHRSVRPNSYPHWHNTGNVLM